MMLSNLLCTIVLSILGLHLLVVDAGWRPILSRTSTRRYALTSISKQHAKTDGLLGRSSSLHSLFGVGNLDSVGMKRKRCLASIAASIRGGSSDDETEDGNDISDAQNKDESDSLFSKNKASPPKEPEEHDEERYSRQMYALGARAHQLVRSTTAILDGPLGGIKKKHLSPLESTLDEITVDDVGLEGADGFEGLEGTLSGIQHDVRRSRSETPSGLLYELAKNLALSGVGRIILVQDDDNYDVNGDGYFDGSLDDLGAAYHRAAIAEIIPNSENRRGSDSNEIEQGDSDIDEADDFTTSILNDGAVLLAEYIQRLNPGVQVDIIERSKLIELLQSESVDRGIADEGDLSDEDDEDERDNTISLGTNPVVVCVDRSISSQLQMNDICRKGGRIVPFISVETAGVHAKLFCDFGTNFVVVDEDGETARSTLLDKVEVVEEDDGGNDDSEKMYTVKCLEDERHDVSKGDVIEFQGEHSDDTQPSLDGGAKATFPKCQVVSVKSPRQFTIKEWREGDSDNSASSSLPISSLVEAGKKARSFSRVKIPKQTSFKSLRDVLQPKGDDDSIDISACCNDDTIFAPSDLDKSFDPVRRRAVMTCMLALDQFVTKYGRLPTKSKSGGHKHSHKHRTDIERFVSLVQKLTKEEDGASMNQEQWNMLVKQFASTCRAKFTPVQALSGALGAQEVLKAATGLYNPVRQFLLYDCDEVLQGSESGEASETELSTAAPGQTYILGESISNKLACSRLFLVGAGAIGCELLKNLAAMGAGTGVSNTKRGCIILTDMDTIEKSNLSRQLLFRDHDVGEFKSVAARAAMMRFSPECDVEAHTSRVGEEDDGPFGDDFWSSGCNVVLNALDNVEARLFVDSQCVAHGLGLIDAGTLGPKGNVQVVVPHESESYGSSADPPEPDIPVCTLKNFPYEISHTIQWARDLFDGYFHRRPRQANDHVNVMAQTEELTAFGQLLIEKLGDDAAVDMAAELGEDLGPFPFIVGNAGSNDPEYVQAVKKVSLDWAIQQAHQLFYVSMDELIQKHPIDSVDDDGAPFWSGTRRVPRPLRFIPLDSEEDEVSAQQVIINERIAQFVSSAARLRIETFLPLERDEESSSITPEEALFALQEQAKLLYKKKKSKEILHNLSGGGSDGDRTLSLIIDKLNGAKTGASFLPRLNLADFEKDDESNGHVAFVTAASNLRAMSYGIPPADAMETRRVAGRIVPAMITTTGLVSALSCLELVKLLKGLPLTSHRNAFVNLALPFFAFTSPMPAEEVEGVDGKTHTIWDRITVKGSNKSPTHSMSLSKFMKKIQKKAGFGDEIEVSSISYGPYMIYANFLHSFDEELLNTPLLDTVQDAVISEDDDEDEMAMFDEEAPADGEKKPPVELTAEQKAMISKLDQKRCIDFSVIVEDSETGEEFELPPVRLFKDKRESAAEED